MLNIGFLFKTFFPWSTLNALAQCLQVSKASDEKYTENNIEDLCVMSCISPAAFKFLSLHFKFFKLFCTLVLCHPSCYAHLTLNLAMSFHKNFILSDSWPRNKSRIVRFPRDLCENWKLN